MIKVFSTYTIDNIIDKKNNKQSTKKGGPAFYIENVFKKNDIRYKLFTGDPIRVKITVTEKGETGTIESDITSKLITEFEHNSIILISTVSNEWILNSNIKEIGKIFLDVQGYVRAAKNDESTYKSSFWNNIFCMKGTREEIDSVPREIIEHQKAKLLIITNGSDGCNIFFKNNEYRFRPKNIINAKDTVGAGDTFFAGFISEFMHTNDIINSGNFAAAEAEKFLTSKDNE